jgi:hypothetical protein
MLLSCVSFARYFPQFTAPGRIVSVNDCQLTVRTTSFMVSRCEIRAVARCHFSETTSSDTGNPRLSNRGRAAQVFKIVLSWGKSDVRELPGPILALPHIEISTAETKTRKVLQSKSMGTYSHYA